jgi:hypothetical protein
MQENPVHLMMRREELKQTKPIYLTSVSSHSVKQSQYYHYKISIFGNGADVTC